MAITALLHQRVFEAVRLAAELQELAVVDEAGDDGSG